MKAKEMFEKLGFELVKKDEEEIMYMWQDCEYKYTVKFYLLAKEFECIYEIFKIVKRRTIDVEEHQAITQQMKELGWIE